MSRHGFGEALAAVRKEQGYATPFAFFKGRGGRKGLGLTFANYLSLEKGENLPKGWRLKKLIDALGLEAHDARTRGLLRAYFAGVLGSPELVDLLLGAGADPVSSGQSLAERAARQARAATRIQLDLSQYKILADNPGAYACHVILCNTAGWTEGAHLAKLTGHSLPQIRKELQKLKAAKLALVSGAKARSTLEKHFVEPPTPTVALSAAYAKMSGHRRRWVEDRGRAVHGAYLLLRARKGTFAQYFDHLDEAVKMSAIYGDMDPAADSEMYLVEGKITRLFA